MPHHDDEDESGFSALPSEYNTKSIPNANPSSGAQDSHFTFITDVTHTSTLNMKLNLALAHIRDGSNSQLNTYLTRTPYGTPKPTLDPPPWTRYFISTSDINYDSLTCDSDLYTCSDIKIAP
ncbi:Netrin Receptor Unc5C [Manis pentadactyla]|nr:Netrin Receptor Unc5C [Manis pentadactyla]